jgi:DNA invertase Pin-like site-specific DNA recombinase
MTVVLIYARASADPSDQKISVDRQVKLGRAKAAELWPDAEIRVFRDDGITAANPDVHRPGYAAFLTAVRTARKGELAGVVCSEQSRLTRQPGEWDSLVITLTKAGVTKIETRSGPISVEPGNRLTGRILAVVDAEEVERTKARLAVAHHQLFIEGRPSGGPSFGYRAAKGSDGRPTFVPEPAEAVVVAKVFDMAVAGYSLAAIKQWLNDEGVLPRSARLKFKSGRSVTTWGSLTVRCLLTSTLVAGLRGHTDPDGVLHTVPGNWPALVDPDKWRQVQRILGQPAVVIGTDGQTFRVRTKPRPQGRQHLLSGGTAGGEVTGILRCWRCQNPLIAQTRRGSVPGSRVPAYGCGMRAPGASPGGSGWGCGAVSISPADEVDASVVEAMQERLATSPDLRRRLSVAKDSEAGRWRAERDAAKGRMLSASEMFGSGAIDQDSFDAMHRPAQAAFKAAQARLDALTATDTVLPSLADVQERWDDLPLAQQRAVMARLIGRIVIGPGKSRGRWAVGLDDTRIGEPDWLTR